jgi:carboxylesterase
MIRPMAANDVEIFGFPPQEGDLEPFDLGAGDVGVLLIHGFCGTPPEMRGLGEHLALSGFRVRGTLLPGHGTTPEDLVGYNWRDWVAGARRDLEELKKKSSAVCVAGQSMGGTISLALAEADPEIRAVATMSALLRLPARTELLLQYGRFVRRWHYPDRDSVDLTDVSAVGKLRSYNKRSMKSHYDLLQLMRQVRAHLPQVTAPTLVLHGMRDALVPPNNAELIRSGVSGPVEVAYFERSGHAMTVDVDHGEIFDLVANHMRRAAETAQPMRRAMA